MSKQHMATIRGIILASGWKKNGGISAVDIAGYDEKKYRVVNDEIGKQLRAYIKKRIIADGVIMIQNNRLTIHVDHFEIDTSDPKHPAG